MAYAVMAACLDDRMDDVRLLLDGLCRGHHLLARRIAVAVAEAMVTAERSLREQFPQLAHQSAIDDWATHLPRRLCIAAAADPSHEDAS